VRKLYLSPEAEEDLIEAAEYLDQATANNVFGNQLLDDMDRVMDLIAENPSMGRARPELRKGLRGFSRGHYTIFWRLHDQEIEIVRVLHHRQDAEREFGVKR
jgi:toxin ParE1/3/4